MTAAPTPARAVRARLSRLVWTLCGLTVAGVWTFPVYWMANTAFKPGRDMQTVTPQFWPHHPTLANFRTVVTDAVFWRALRNSAIVTVLVVLVAMAVAFLAALAIARFRFRGRRALLLAVMIVQMVPLNAVVIPLFLMFSAARLSDTLPGLVLAYLAFAMPFAVWTLRGFLSTIPVELEEAAMVDGCGRFGAFVRVVLPLLLPGLIATSIYTMILAWNEFMLTYFLISSPDNYTLPLWLTHFTLSEGTEYGPLMAGSTLIALPVVVFFMLVQRKVAGGLTAGAVKG
ncbi:carbohydrate ABC transporter permease [Krasilnikovia sp. MM14-A1004]|uniref:carbohydrate ABC transporter permease n=1 Tax=Krasilnikovia sp. MM14-A1004 TaxID=3373541 RepID=UPI00399C64A4